MYVVEILGALRRCWYIAIAGVVVTAVLCAGTARLIPVSYTATSSVLLLPPKSTLNTDGNPYRALGGLEIAGDVLARSMTDAVTVQDLAPPDGSASYTVQPDATSSGPILKVEVVDRSADGALATEAAVLERMPIRLRLLQTDSGAPSDSLLQMAVITRDDTANRDSKSQLRSLIVVAVLGLVLTVLVAAGVDAAIRRRRHRRPNEALSSTSPENATAGRSALPGQQSPARGDSEGGERSDLAGNGASNLRGSTRPRGMGHHRDRNQAKSGEY